MLFPSSTKSFMDLSPVLDFISINCHKVYGRSTFLWRSLPAEPAGVYISVFCSSQNNQPIVFCRAILLRLERKWAFLKAVNFEVNISYSLWDNRLCEYQQESWIPVDIRHERNSIAVSFTVYHVPGEKLTPGVEIPFPVLTRKMKSNTLKTVFRLGLPLLAERPGSVFTAYTILYGKHCF